MNSFYSFKHVYANLKTVNITIKHIKYDLYMIINYNFRESLIIK
jgi:hypothetical protein